MTEERIKHLEFIQNIITRVNTNSFQLKSLTITIVAALMAVYISVGNSNFVLVGLFPTIIFWFLDAFYLQQERKFRGLYDDVAGVTEKAKDIKLFEMRPDLYIGGKYNYFNVFRSETIGSLYLSIIILLIILFIFLNTKCYG